LTTKAATSSTASSPRARSRRYIRAAQVLFPGAAEKAEARMFEVAG
jgi:hypothetical protein